MVELSITAVQRRAATGEGYIRESGFLPLNLKWAHTGKTTRDHIPPFTERHCDLLHILKPKQGDSIRADLDLEVMPNTGGGQLATGEYRLVLEVAATNARAQRFSADLSVPHSWGDSVDETITNGFYFRGLPTGAPER